MQIDKSKLHNPNKYEIKGDITEIDKVLNKCEKEVALEKKMQKRINEIKNIDEKKFLLEILKDYQELLDLEENETTEYLEGYITEPYVCTDVYAHITYLIEKYKQEKEKNKKIKDGSLDGILIIGRSSGKTATERKIILDEYISKDKIREKVKELEKTRERLTDSNGMLEISASIDILKELLEGE